MRHGPISGDNCLHGGGFRQFTEESRLFRVRIAGLNPAQDFLSNPQLEWWIDVAISEFLEENDSDLRSPIMIIR